MFSGVTHPLEELEYAVKDSDAVFLVASTPALLQKLQPLSQKLGLPLIDISDIKIGETPRRGLELKPGRAALMLYTRSVLFKKKEFVILIFAQRNHRTS